MPSLEANYSIHLDGRWSLEDLYVFPRSFEQVYYAWQALTPTSDDYLEERISRAFHVFPWQGGYSAVNFYQQLKYAIPPKSRPQIISIRYGSPGEIDLQLVVDTAKHLAEAVVLISGAIIATNKAYHDIYTGMQKRELLRIKNEKETIELVKKHKKFITDSAEELCEILSIPDSELVLSRTPNDLIAVKILLSLYRRIRTLADFQAKGKVDFRK